MAMATLPCHICKTTQSFHTTASEVVDVHESMAQRWWALCAMVLLWRSLGSLAHERETRRSSFAEKSRGSEAEASPRWPVGPSGQGGPRRARKRESPSPGPPTPLRQPPGQGLQGLQGLQDGRCTDRTKAWEREFFRREHACSKVQCSAVRCGALCRGFRCWRSSWRRWPPQKEKAVWTGRWSFSSHLATSTKLLMLSPLQTGFLLPKGAVRSIVFGRRQNIVEAANSVGASRLSPAASPSAIQFVARLG